MSEAVADTYGSMAAPRRPTGRPSKRTPEVIAEIVDRLAKGEPLAKICADSHMPDFHTVWRWETADESFSQATARARLHGTHHMADECVQIADDPTLDPQDKRVRIDTRLKLIGKWNAKAYGDNMQLRHADADGEKLNTQPLVSELLTMLGPGATLQAAVRVEAPAAAPALPSAFGPALLDVTPTRVEQKDSAPAAAQPAQGYRPRGKARPASDVDDLV